MSTPDRPLNSHVEAIAIDGWEIVKTPSRWRADAPQHLTKFYGDTIIEAESGRNGLDIYASDEGDYPITIPHAVAADLADWIIHVNPTSASSAKKSSTDRTTL